MAKVIWNENGLFFQPDIDWNYEPDEATTDHIAASSDTPENTPQGQ